MQPQLSSLQNAVLEPVSDEPSLSSNQQSGAARNCGAAQDRVQLTHFHSVLYAQFCQS